MKFIQTIAFTSSQEDALRALGGDWDSQNVGDAPGYLGSKILKDRDRENSYMVIAEFETYEQAMENSARPETDAMAKQMAALVDGAPTFTNYDVIDEQTP
jgi:antibiotic biosynthesis monooxygenase (ABM) superfamily enzyme